MWWTVFHHKHYRRERPLDLNAAFIVTVVAGSVLPKPVKKRQIREDFTPLLRSYNPETVAAQDLGCFPLYWLPQSGSQ